MAKLLGASAKAGFSTKAWMRANSPLFKPLPLTSTTPKLDTCSSGTGLTIIWQAAFSWKRCTMAARLSWAGLELRLSINTSGNTTTKSSSPITGLALKMAWPKPKALPWRMCIIFTPLGVMERTSSSNCRFTRVSRVDSSSNCVSKWFSMEFLLPWVTSTMSLIPVAAISLTMYWIMGLSTMGSISLGMALVAGNIRVPKPATGIIAFIIPL